MFVDNFVDSSATAATEDREFCEVGERKGSRRRGGGSSSGGGGGGRGGDNGGGGGVRRREG